ncbi:hypothetical protein L208DRAFT_1509133, partial [Tricholoma matsutake]
KTSGGTSNLQLGVAQCNKCHGISGTQVSSSGPPYSEAAHRALIASHLTQYLMMIIRQRSKCSSLVQKSLIL